MTREDIIRMAREVDIDWHKHWDDEENRLERFAALVAAAEREAIIDIIEEYCLPRLVISNMMNDIRARREKWPSKQ